VTPRSSRDGIAGWQDGVLRVRLAAPPVEGRANEALRRLLARAAGLPPSRAHLVSGGTSREKRVRFEDIDAPALYVRLGIPPAQSD
jgi:uncharacterized protein YggU (UPF0235/DUF167 family)